MLPTLLDLVIGNRTTNAKAVANLFVLKSIKDYTAIVNTGTYSLCGISIYRTGFFVVLTSE